MSRNYDFKNHFPDYSKDYVPQRKFFWTLYLSLYPEEAEKELEAYRTRKLGVEKVEDTTVEMHISFFEEFQNYQAKPGK